MVHRTSWNMRPQHTCFCFIMFLKIFNESVFLVMLNFDRSAVKHGTHNIQNDCHQWLSDSFRVHQANHTQLKLKQRKTYRFSFFGTWCQDLPTGSERGKGEGKGRGRKGERPPPSQIPGFTPKQDPENCSMRSDQRQKSGNAF